MRGEILNNKKKRDREVTEWGKGERDRVRREPSSLTFLSLWGRDSEIFYIF